VEQCHTDGQAASWKTVVGMHSARCWEAQPKLVRGQLLQTCVAGARQHTIASGSCCYMPRGSNRSRLEFRTTNFGASEHAQAGRCYEETVLAALETVS